MTDVELIEQTCLTVLRLQGHPTKDMTWISQNQALAYLKPYRIRRQRLNNAMRAGYVAFKKIGEGKTARVNVKFSDVKRLVNNEKI